MSALGRALVAFISANPEEIALLPSMKEMSVIPTAALLATIGASRRDLENWLRRIELSTEFEPTSPGRERLFSRSNALELAFIAALVKAGAPPRRASALSVFFLDLMRSEPEQFPKWFAFPAGNPDWAFVIEEPDQKAFDGLRASAKERNAPAVFAFVHLGDIVEKVDRVFGTINPVEVKHDPDT